MDLLQIVYMSWEEHKLLLISTLPSSLYPTPLPTFHAKTQFTEDQKTLGTRKQFIWKHGSPVVNLCTLLVISRLYDVMYRDVIPQDLTQAAAGLSIIAVKYYISFAYAGSSKQESK